MPHDHKPRQRDKGKILNRNMDKKNNKWKSSGSSGRPLQVNTEPDQTHSVGSSSFGDSEIPVNPLYHLSIHGESFLT